MRMILELANDPRLSFEARANARQEKGVLTSMQKIILLHAISVIKHVVRLLCVDSSDPKNFRYVQTTEKCPNKQRTNERKNEWMNGGRKRKEGRKEGIKEWINQRMNEWVIKMSNLSE